ncbi:MAG: fasciclin domain-containing protein, partial [Bacteroidia bacterium]|nr:fasciclin domain-containing protein [Bacteroidia bacterium]NNJ55998.1 fasciclin domain-containing protein [Bacteroidia bacterium]
MKNLILLKSTKLMAFAIALMLTTVSVTAQTNVYDDIIATSSNHTYLKAAIDQQGLASALQNSSSTLTVFAPDNDAFDSLAVKLNTDINGLLALSNLTDILLYHVVGTEISSASISNGDIETPLSTTNTLKLTKTSAGAVFANHSKVNTPDLNADNGVVHSMNAVLLPSETVVDVALDNGFSTLATAVITAELLPALTDPFATYTVFAPTNDAFDSIAVKLNTDINGLLGLSNLADILTYHVLGSKVMAADVTNGAVVQPLSTTNSLKMTVTSDSKVYANQAQV